MISIKDIFDIIKDAQNWTGDQWTTFFLGGLLGSFLTWVIMSAASRIWPRRTSEEKQRIAFEKHKLQLETQLDKLKIKHEDCRVRTWDNNLRKLPVHVKIKSDKTCRIILPSGKEEVVPTSQLEYMNEEQ